MRIVVYGLGAIGGTIATALAASGKDVVGIARGARLRRVQEDGLVLTTPGGTLRQRIPCAGDPTEIGLRPDDVILLTMKTQDTIGALDRLKAAGVRDQAIFCVQNGVSNERFALRRFREVHGVCVQLPALLLESGEICAFTSPRHGLLDIGRYPSGLNHHDEDLAAALNEADIAAFASRGVMAHKYGKLLVNLSNVVESAVGRAVDHRRVSAVLQEEGKAVLRAAGISWLDLGASDARRDQLARYTPIPGVEHLGNSTTQSFLRGAGNVETPFLNGEIVLLGRLLGVPAPANEFFVELSDDMLGSGIAAGKLRMEDIVDRLSKIGVKL